LVRRKQKRGCEATVGELAGLHPWRLRSCYNDGEPQDLGGEQVMSRQTKTNAIFTLAEAARYLRLSQEAVKKQAQRGDIPGRQVGKHWRFLKAALDDWLRRPSSKSVLLEMAGAFKDDDTLPELRKAIQAARAQLDANREADDGTGD